MAPIESEFSQMDQALGQIAGVFGSSPIRWRAVELEVPESARIVASCRASIAELRLARGGREDPRPARSGAEVASSGSRQEGIR
jgi:hypothetical protein